MGGVATSSFMVMGFTGGVKCGRDLGEVFARYFVVFGVGA